MTIGDYYKTNSMNTSSGQAATRFGTVLDFLGKLGDPTVRQFRETRSHLGKPEGFPVLYVIYSWDVLVPLLGGWNLD